MRTLIIDGIRCVAFEGLRVKIMVEGFPFRYEGRHAEEYSIPLTIETDVLVNNWGTIFAEKSFGLVGAHAYHPISLILEETDDGIEEVFRA
jgi:hypothetical protein